MTSLPREKRARLILNTDAKNEADDQFTIVHALLTPTFDFHGLIAAHFGAHRSKTSMDDSRKEIDHLLELMNLEGRIPVANGAATGCGALTAGIALVTDIGSTLAPPNNANCCDMMVNWV